MKQYDIKIISSFIMIFLVINIHIGIYTLVKDIQKTSGKDT